MQEKAEPACKQLGCRCPHGLLGNLTDAFQEGALNMASSVAGRLHSVGYDVPRIFDVKPMLDKYSVFG